MNRRKKRPSQAYYQPEIIDYRSLEAGTVGRAIVNRREYLQLNQKQLAKLAGVTPAAMCRIELGQAVPRAHTLQRICTGLQCSLTQLIYPVSPRQAANTASGAAGAMRSKASAKA